MTDGTKERILFPTGKVVATPGALQALNDPDCPHVKALILLARHVTGDWGTVDAEDWEANDRSVNDGTRILSAYDVDDVSIWVITEADRSVTTLLLPEEY